MTSTGPRRAPRWRRRTAGPLLALSLAGPLAACAGPATSPATSSVQPTAVATPPAAQLRAQLDGLLRQDVDLIAFAVQSAAPNGVAAGQTQGGWQAVDANARALAKAIAGPHGGRPVGELLALWRRHVTALSDYAAGVLANDVGREQQAITLAAGTIDDLASYLNSFTDEHLSRTTVVADLVPDEAAIRLAIDAITARRPDAASAVLAAAGRADPTARDLAGALTRAGSTEGDVDGQTADLLTAMTGRLIQHAAQLSVLTQAVAAYGPNSPEAAGARAALDDNSAALAQLIGSTYDEAAAGQFSALWRTVTDQQQRYLMALPDHDQVAETRSQRLLAGALSSVGAQFAALSRGAVTAEAATSALRVDSAALHTAAQAIVARSPKAGGAVAAAESQAAATATLLAAAIAHQQRFPT